ncbi:MAG: aminoglycoside phosphotransferase family protein [Opitutaceae bacterium]|jgi:aminoglycoside phosphotransferase (APT) family kinase protein|nr:aminoglycoside phosphotransferase family protein [Opitutaceae bacterium]
MNPDHPAQPPAPPVDLAAIARGFALHGQCLGGRPHGNGHINDTYAVAFDQAGAPVRYIFQRVNNRVFKDVPALMDNISRVTARAAGRAAELGGDDASRRALTLVPARDGRPYLVDEHGAFWRCYLFIEKARTYDIVETPAHAREAARAFGDFQRLLTGLPGARLHETIPDFHNTRRRYENLLRAIDADPLNRAAAVRDEIAFAKHNENLVDVLAKLHAAGEAPERVTHNDTKFNNVMLDDATHTGVCVIDLDTVMPGLALHDFGDMVRSATNAAAEDEPDLSKVSMRMPVYEGLVAGYLAAAGDFLTEAERAHLAFSGRLITFEIGLRFLTDHIEGDVYFKTRRPGHNLDRARNQFALVRDIDARQSAMEAVAARLFQERSTPAPIP